MIFISRIAIIYPKVEFLIKNSNTYIYPGYPVNLVKFPSRFFAHYIFSSFSLPMNSRAVASPGAEMPSRRSTFPKVSARMRISSIRLQ
jgi:hypothetical protein